MAHRHLQDTAGTSIKKIVQTLRTPRSATIEIDGQRLTPTPTLPAPPATSSCDSNQVTKLLARDRPDANVKTDIDRSRSKNEYECPGPEAKNEIPNPANPATDSRELSTWRLTAASTPGSDLHSVITSQSNRTRATRNAPPATV
jgi:hypothetical protein